MADTNAFIYLNPIYTTSGSASLTGTVGAVDLTRLYYNGRQSLVANNSLTWGTLKYNNKIWGTDKPINYPTVVYDYHYFWNLETAEFTVTDNFGEDTVFYPIESIKDLQVSWGVLDNIEFIKRYISIDDLFLVAEKRDSKRALHAEIVGEMVNSDYLVNGFQHAVFSKLVSHLSEPGELNYLVEDIFGNELAKTILIPNMRELLVSNVYPVDLLKGSLDIHSKRSEDSKTGAHFSDGQFLMIAMFAQKLLSADNKVVYEPWMLYATFQWYFDTSHIAMNNRRIFDLSPRW